jgi:FkbM family methyltransferase
MKTIIYKFIYNPTVNKLIRPISKLFYSITGKKLFSISGKINAKTRGVNFILSTNQTSSVTQDIFYNGANNYEFTPLFSELIKKCSVFLDIGANIGYFSVLGAKINPSCKIIAFEPSVGSLHYLKENLKLNDIKNVEIIDKAVSNFNETLTFYEVKNTKYPWIKHNLNGSNSLEGKYIQKETNAYPVQTISISTLITEKNIQEVSLIKLDTECTEHLIIESALLEINQFQPIIISEVYPVIEDKIETLIFSLNEYAIYQIKNHKELHKINHFKDINKNDLDRNFVFVPENKLNLLKDFIC